MPGARLDRASGLARLNAKDPFNRQRCFHDGESRHQPSFSVKYGQVRPRRCDGKKVKVFAAFGEINWVSVALASVASSILGGVWFTVLFGKLYAASLGRQLVPTEKPGLMFVLGPFVCGLVATITTALLLRVLTPNDFFQALGFGLIWGLGFVVSTMVNVAINPNFPRPFLYSAVCGPYFLIATVMSTLILHVMG